MSTLTRVVAPNLPLAPAQFEPSYQEQLNNVLRLYFNQISNNINEMIGPLGVRYLSSPASSVQRTTDFEFPANNTAAQITFDTADYVAGSALNPNDGISVAQAGVYNYQFSIQFANTDTQTHTAYVWLRKNGVDIPATGSKFDVPSSHGSSDGYLIATCNFFVQLDADDSVEMWAAVTQRESAGTNGVYIEAYAAQTSPFVMPSIPSVVATLSFVSEAS